MPGAHSRKYKNGDGDEPGHGHYAVGLTPLQSFFLGLGILAIIAALVLGIIGVARAYDTNRKIFTLEQLIVLQNAVINNLTLTGDTSITSDLTVFGPTTLEELTVNNDFITVGDFELFGNGTNRFEHRTNIATIGPLASGAPAFTIEFDTPIAGALGAYSVITDLFTIPEDGLYSFETHVAAIFTAPTGFESRLILTLGTFVYTDQRVFPDGPAVITSNPQFSSISVVTYLYAGDTAEVQFFFITGGLASIPIGAAFATITRLA